MSGYIRNLAIEAGTEAERRSRWKEVLRSCAALQEDELPPITLINTVGSHNASHYKEQMTLFFSEIAGRCGLEPESNVLDLGCGCGRLAVPFLKYLSGGRYFGFDVWEDGIRWCRENLVPKHGNAEFHLVPVVNNYYFDEMSKASNSFDLGPVTSGSVDLAFSVSVFTHLIEGDCQAYLRELGRVLGDNGVLYFTGFVVDRFFMDYAKRTGKFSAVAESSRGCYYAYRGQDFFAGFSKEKWANMIWEAGLEVIAFEPGGWAAKPGSRMFQDTYIAVKA